MNVEQRRQAAADPQTKPTDLGCESSCRLLSSTSTIAILLLFSHKADTHFTVPPKVEDWVDLGLRFLGSSDLTGSRTSRLRNTICQLHHNPSFSIVMWHVELLRRRLSSLAILAPFWFGFHLLVRNTMAESRPYRTFLHRISTSHQYKVVDVFHYTNWGPYI